MSWQQFLSPENNNILEISNTNIIPKLKQLSKSHTKNMLPSCKGSEKSFSLGFSLCDQDQSCKAKDDSFSQMFHDNNAKKDRACILPAEAYHELMGTLRELKEINREHLIVHKKILSIIEQRGFKTLRKSHLKEKSLKSNNKSTIKKNTLKFETINCKIKQLEKLKSGLQVIAKKDPDSRRLIKTKKKSQSAFR